MNHNVHTHAPRGTPQYGVWGWGPSPNYWLIVWQDGDCVMRALPGRHTEIDAMRLALSLSTYSVTVN